MRGVEGQNGTGDGLRDVGEIRRGDVALRTDHLRTGRSEKIFAEEREITVISDAAGHNRDGDFRRFDWGGWNGEIVGRDFRGCADQIQEKWFRHGGIHSAVVRGVEELWIVDT